MLLIESFLFIRWMENIKTLTVKIALLEELRKEMSLNEIHLQGNR